MNRINSILLSVFVASLGLFAVVFSFYIAAMLIPVLLAIVVATGLANLVIYLYKSYRTKKQGNCKVNIHHSKKNKPEIIDAEYEIMDDK